MKMFQYILIDCLIDCSCFFLLIEEKENKKEKDKQKKIHLINVSLSCSTLLYSILIMYIVCLICMYSSLVVTTFFLIIIEEKVLISLIMLDD